MLIVSTRAFHSTNLFLFSSHHIPPNNIAPLSAYKHTQTHNPYNHSDKGLSSKHQLLNSLWWPIYVINSVDNAKLFWKNTELLNLNFIQILFPFDFRYNNEWQGPQNNRKQSLHHKKILWKFPYVADGEDQAVTHFGSFRLKSVMERLKVNWELYPLTSRSNQHLIFSLQYQPWITLKLTRVEEKICCTNFLLALEEIHREQ